MIPGRDIWRAAPLRLARRCGGLAVGFAMVLLILASALADARTDAVKTFIALKQGVLSGASYEEFRTAAVDTKAVCEFAAATVKPPLNKAEKQSCDALIRSLDAGLAIFRHRFDDCPSPGLCTDYYLLYRDVV